MEKKIQAKIYFKDEPKNVVAKLDDLFSIVQYETIKEKILEKDKKNRLTKVDKFVLELEENLILKDLKSIWEQDTYNYFIERIKLEPPKKIKLFIKKVDDYPDKPTLPKEGAVIKDSLQSAWNITKKKIVNELKEKHLDEAKRIFIQEKKENSQNSEAFEDLHVNIICNNCLTSNISGIRYICSECDNFNLCEFCQEKSRTTHNPEHTFIRVNNQILVDIQKFSSIFNPNKMLIKKTYELFDITIDVLNNGEESLQGCFISPIRFGKNYLGCLKKTITDECKKGDKVSLNVLIKFEDLEETNKSKIYEGFFRLMTKEGIPFGDIFHLKVLII